MPIVNMSKMLMAMARSGAGERTKGPVVKRRRLGYHPTMLGSRLRHALPAFALGLALSSLGCQAKPEACEPLAQHIVEVAKAEGQAGSGTAFALQQACEEHPPSRKLVKCMMAAETMADINAC